MKTLKTNQIMKRSMGNFVVEQRTKDSMFNATHLLKQWNESHSDKNNRDLSNFWKSTHLYEFMLEIVKDPENGFSLPDSTYPRIGDAKNQPYSTSVESTHVDFTHLKNMLSSNSRARADRGGGTWMHPYLFVKFAMYLNPAFEYRVVKFVSDQLILKRHKTGVQYRDKFTGALKSCGIKGNGYAIVAGFINELVFGYHKTGIRNTATQEQLDKIEDIQKEVVAAHNYGYINNKQSLKNLLFKIRTNHAVE